MRIIQVTYLDDDQEHPSGSRAATLLERELATIWQDVLNRLPARPDDHFFELGGNSLGVSRVAARIEERYGVQVPLPQLFHTPTLAGMAAALQAARSRGISSSPAVQARAHEELSISSLAQERFWLLHHIDAAGTAYSVAGALRIAGPLSVRATQDSLRKVVERHEALRTTFVHHEGQLLQQVRPPEFQLEQVDLARSQERPHLDSALNQHLQTAIRRPFDLAQGPVFRATLFQLAVDDHMLLFDLPHINSDAWSIGLLIEEFAQGYAAELTGRELRLPDLPLQYRDYAAWQREWLAEQTLEPLRAYWLPRLQNLEPLELPIDRPRPPILTFAGVTVSTSLPAALLTDLRRLGREHDATLFMVLLTAFKVLLFRWTGRTDVAVGTPVAGRHTPGVERLIGVFVNTLVMRTDLQGHPSFHEALNRVRDTAVGAFGHQDMPFAQLVMDLQPTRDLSRSPLVQVMFNQINVPMPAYSLPDLQLTPLELDRGGAQFDLSCTVIEVAGAERLMLEYNTALFERGTIETLLARFLHLLHEVTGQPDCPVDALPMLIDTERQQLASWSGTAGAAPSETLHELFESQVRRTPDQLALRCGSQEVRYRDLNAQANQLARHLQCLGVRSETLVAICLPRSVEAVVATLAVLKAGGAFVPLDPSQPPARLGELLQDAHPRVLLTTAELAPLWSPGAATLVCLTGDASDGEWSGQDDTDLNVPGQPDGLAYLLYTSGTSGFPKGVLGTHQGVVYRLRWMWDAYPFQEGEACCQKTSPAFVDSLWELFGPLLAGVPLVLIPDETVRDPLAFVEMLAQERITRLVLVPSVLRVLLDVLDNGRPLPDLTLWSASGEPLSVDLARRFRQVSPTARLLNLYGSTEVAADATWEEVTGSALPDTASASVSVGRPLPGARVYVVDDALQQVPPGTPGELLIGGHGLARGYHERPELTAQRFLPNPFGVGLVFRTHDRAAFSPDGRLQLLGRLDRQVKIRGVGVEPQEVEVLLLRHPLVEDCAVQPSQSQPPELIAHVVLRAPATPSELRLYLSGLLPGPAVPSRILALGALPRTASGKLDRQRLPPPPVGGSGTTPPRTHLEQRLADLWADVLPGHPEQIGVYDSFFDLGGHSLLAARLIARLELAFGVRMPLATLFQGPTIAHLADYLGSVGDPSQLPVLVHLQSHGHRPPLFVVHGIGGHLLELRELFPLLAPDQPVYGLEAVGIDGVSPPLDSIDAMVERYLREIRQVQPHGPYYLCGHSFGGIVAFELARQFRESGEPVALLALLDTWTPRPLRAPVRMVMRAVTRQVHAELQRARRSPQGYVQWNARRLQVLVREASRSLWRRMSRIPPDARRSDLPSWLHDVWKVHLQALERYHARPLDVPTVLFRAEERRLIEPLFDWADFIQPSLHVVTVGGSHARMVQTPHVHGLAGELQGHLTAAQAVHETDG